MNKVLGLAMPLFAVITFGRPAIADTICVHVVIDVGPRPVHQCPDFYNGGVLCPVIEDADHGVYAFVEICLPDPTPQPKTAR